MESQSKLGGGMAWVNWLLATAFVVFVFTFQTGYAVTSIGMKDDLGLTVAQVGVIGSIYTWAFAFAQFVSGSILDRFGIRWVLPLACALVAAGGLVFANADSALVLVLGQVMMALGASFGFVGAGFTGGAWFGMMKYGIMFALVQFVASLSAIFGQRILGTLVTDFAWNELLNGMALLGCALTVLMFLIMRNPKGDQQELIPWTGLRNFLDDVVKAINEVTAIRDSWVNALIGGATFGSMLALGVVWGPNFLMAAGMEQKDAFFTSSMMWAGLAIGAPIFAWLSDKIQSRKRPMFAGALLQFITITLIISQPGMSATEANVYFFIWGFMAGASMLNFPIGAELVKPELTGTSAAIVNAVQFIVGGIIMAIPGRVLDGKGFIARVAQIETEAPSTVNDYQWAMVIIPIVLAVALVLFMFLRETFPKNEREME